MFELVITLVIDSKEIDLGRSHRNSCLSKKERHCVC